MDRRGSQKNEPKDKEVGDYVQGLTFDNICQKIKKGEKSPASKIVLTHQYKDSRNTLKRVKETNYSN